MDAAVELYPEIPVALHQDHGNLPETCFSAIELGFTSVMMDGSLLSDGKTPSDFEYNVAVTRQVVEYAHARGVSVEGELGTLGGIEHGVGSGVVHLTDPDQAVEFVERTGIDALAVAIGTSHGAYKFTQPPTGEVLAIDLIEAIHRRLPETHRVMHGSSPSLLKELVDVINRSGGEIRPTWGVPVEEIEQGIRHGVRKVNVDTDLRLAMTGAILDRRWPSRRRSSTPAPTSSRRGLRCRPSSQSGCGNSARPGTHATTSREPSTTCNSCTRERAPARPQPRPRARTSHGGGRDRCGALGRARRQGIRRSGRR